MNTQKMYVLTRKDLAETYRIVQGSHALAKFALEHREEFEKWNNTTIVYLGVWNLMELREWSCKLTKYERVHSLWREPDQDNAETAIACFDDGKIFKDLGLA